MEVPIYYRGEEAGTLTVTADGLYWQLTGFCRIPAREILRLYGAEGLGSEPFGVLLPEGVGLQLHRRLSKHSCPVLPSRWIAGRECEGFRPWRGAVEDQEIPDAMLRADPDGQTLALPVDREPIPLAEYAPQMEPMTLNGRAYLALKLRDWVPVMPDQGAES